LRSREQHRPTAPLRPLLVKELREVAGGRALWIMLLLACPLVGYSFFQAVSLYAEASLAGAQSPVLAASLSPLDGVLVPTFGALYVCVTLLFPFVAIRAVSHEKETGALSLLAQLPYASATLILAKLAAVMTAWLLVSIPALSALIVWIMLGGHLAPAETLNLLLGHLLYGLLVGAVALFAAAIAESAATAAIVTLAFTIGSWVLDFTVAGRPGLFDWVARLSLTQALRGFEQGLFSAAIALGLAAAAVGFAGLACIWLRPGVVTRVRLIRSAAWVLAAAIVIGAATQVRWSADVSEDERNSFAAADQRALARLEAPLTVAVHLTPEDPRFTDLNRNVLAKLARAMPRVSVQLAGGAGERDPRYGEVDYVYGGRTDMSRSTSPREILPLLYALAGVAPPAPAPGNDYPGYPLVARGDLALVWFLGLLPLLIAFAWGLSRRPPSLRLLIKEVHHATG
jgi:ABC-2 type transport system permease protein